MAEALISPTSVADQVFDRLYAEVLSAALPPGTRLSEAEVAARLTVSRQPVHAAFHCLAKLGFLLIQPQKATQISRISARDVRQARFVRLAIEVEVVHLACDRLTEADLAALHDNLAAQRQALQQHDHASFHQLDNAFHAALCAAAGVGFAWAAIHHNKAHEDRVRFLALAAGSQTTYDEHLAIFAALQSRDADAAVTATRHHLGQIDAVMTALRHSNPGWFSDDN